ncbi:MAG: PLP-dependent aminotransferase family protein [Niameybacter sp.]|uniref:MocR-like pyridoxine biosynthesis transcription factor PdxR n=1 Tax=Niameybacter sp. TaxID=2033640 RepID=UPI002FC84FE6
MSFVSIQLDNTSSEPLYLQLFGQIKQAILEDQLPVSLRLPAIRTLAKDLGVNNVTVINAYKQLESSGYVTSKKGSGFYVSKPNTPEISLMTRPTLSTAENTINFSSASPHPAIFPTDSFKTCLDEVLDRDKGFAFGYQEANGFMPLREVLAKYLQDEHHIQASPSCIQIVSGAQQGLDIISKSCLNAGDYVVTEIPTYNGAIDAFKSRGTRIVPVELTSSGIDLATLEKRVNICKPKLVYVMTKFQNPTTLSYAQSTLTALLHLAQKYNFYLVEDDSMSELNYKGKSSYSLKALDTHNQVIYLKSFSKLLMPGLRIGFLVIPECLLDRFTKTKQMTDIAASGLIHRSLDIFFRTNKWETHLRYMKAIYTSKYELMRSELTRLKPYGITYTDPDGGLCFWLSLPRKISAYKLYELCLDKGLLVLPSTLFYPHTHRQKDSFIRITFAPCDTQEITQGIDILEQVLKNYTC